MVVKIYNNIMASKPKSDRFYQFPERALIYAFNNLSSSALRLYIILAGQKNGFLAETELYCKRANIKIEEYNIYENELIEKGFLSRTNEELSIKCPLKAYTVNYDTAEEKQGTGINFQELI
mgnify:CR=1 FL=1